MYHPLLSEGVPSTEKKLLYYFYYGIVDPGWPGEERTGRVSRWCLAVEQWPGWSSGVELTWGWSMWGGSRWEHSCALLTTMFLPLSPGEYLFKFTVSYFAGKLIFTINSQFLVKPSVWVPNQLVGAPLGTDVTIECVIEAFPKAITYWQKSQDGKEKIILNGWVLVHHSWSLTVLLQTRADRGQDWIQDQLEADHQTVLEWRCWNISVRLIQQSGIRSGGHQNLW